MQETYCLTWFDPLLYHNEPPLIYYIKHWPHARLYVTETKSRVNKTDPASILSKFIAHTRRQLQEQLGNHRMNEKWHVDQWSWNVAVLWMKVREKGRIFQKGQFWSWKGVVARDSGDLEANVRLESPQNSAGVRMKDSSAIRSC